jgi:hypothetical protein
LIVPAPELCDNYSDITSDLNGRGGNVVLGTLLLDTRKTYEASSGLPPIKVRASNIIVLYAGVTATHVGEGELAPIWDRQTARLGQGRETERLPAGSYVKDFRWPLQPEATGHIDFRIQATAGSAPQIALVPVEIQADT